MKDYVYTWDPTMLRSVTVSEILKLVNTIVNNPTPKSRAMTDLFILNRDHKQALIPRKELIERRK